MQETNPDVSQLCSWVISLVTHQQICSLVTKDATKITLLNGIMSSLKLHNGFKDTRGACDDAQRNDVPGSPVQAAEETAMVAVSVASPVVTTQVSEDAAVVPTAAEFASLIISEIISSSSTMDRATLAVAHPVAHAAHSVDPSSNVLVYTSEISTRVKESSDAVVAWLTSWGVPFERVDLMQHPMRRAEMKMKSGKITPLPQIFVNDCYVEGGLAELKTMVEAGVVQRKSH